MSSKKKYILIFSMMMLIFSVACQRRIRPHSPDKYSVTVVNSSKVPVHKITYDLQSQSGGGMNADGSQMRPGDAILFDFQKITGIAIWSVLDEDDGIMASDALPFVFDEKNEMMIHIESVNGELELTVKP